MNEPEPLDDDWLQQLIDMIDDATTADATRLTGCLWVLKKAGIIRDDY